MSIGGRDLNRAMVATPCVEANLPHFEIADWFVVAAGAFLS
jgi:hypothetical protein